MNNERINIYGKGGHAASVGGGLDSLGMSHESYDDSDRSLPDGGRWIVAIGDNRTRQRVMEQTLFGRELATLVDLSATCRGELGAGTMIMMGSLIQVGCKIGRGVVINTNASVDHHSIIGDYCHIAPGSTLCGNTKVGTGTLIGAGSTVLPGVVIAEWSVVGAGSIVTQDLVTPGVYYGVPCRLIRERSS